MFIIIVLSGDDIDYMSSVELRCEQGVYLAS